ncbi:hypothetical protein BC835DRAFT_1365376 [Cytidiella melzeri]|nr:hypothetical protein BC835DRAFT_1365376 [Cytidiella melzeri]
MPQNYLRRYSDYPPPARIPLEPRRRSSYALAPASSPTSTLTLPRDNPANNNPQLTDADDSIVLSDLIRTGEQSRLRRRGAMRLDHNATSSAARPPLSAPSGSNNPAASQSTVAQASRPAPGPGTFTRPSTPPWLMPYPSGALGEDDGMGYNGESWGWANEEESGSAGSAGPPLNEQEQRRGANDTDDSFILYCGGDGGTEVSSEEHGKTFEPSPLPWRSSCSFVQRKATSSGRSHQSSRKTNGCGAVVHVRAFPQKPRGVWVGKEEATDIVVGLDQAYFEQTIVARMMKSACGCVREGIGCAVCGNPLGTRYMPCQAASEGLFSNAANQPTPRNTRPLHPSGPRYWQAMQRPTPSLSRSSTARSDMRRPTQGSFYVYTFFSNQVSSSPTCNFPPATKLPRRSPEVRTPYTPTGAGPSRTGQSAETTWLGYSFTGSPLPYSPAPTQPVIPRPRSRSRSRSPVRRSPGLTLTIPSFQVPSSAISIPLGVSATGVPLRSDRAPPAAGETGQLDADGVLIGGEPGVDVDGEPGSPDKIGNDGMLWSGR